MEAAAPSEASPRAFGSAVAALALLAGWLLAMPFADAVSPFPPVLGVVCFAFLLGGSLALAGFAARLPALAWAGAGVSALLFAFARLAWPFVPIPMLLLAGAAWWQSRRPRSPPFAPQWQAAPSWPAPQPAPRRP